MSLKQWLKENHPDVLADAQKVMEERPRYGLMDAVDAIDPLIYHYFCEEVA